MSNDKLSKAIDSLRQYRDRKPLYLHTKTPKQVRDELAARDALIEQLGETIQTVYERKGGGINCSQKSIDLLAAALTAYREWKEANDVSRD